MSGGDDILLVQGGPDDLTDSALRQVLARAPDRSELPDWQLRQTILQRAHEAVAEQAELLAASREPAPWWHLSSWWKKGERRAVTPWNAAFATVLLAGLVTVMWQHEPVPDARPSAAPAPMAEAPRGPAPLPAPAPAPAAPETERAASAPGAAVMTAPPLSSAASDAMGTPPANRDAGVGGRAAGVAGNDAHAAKKASEAANAPKPTPSPPPHAVAPAPAPAPAPAAQAKSMPQPTAPAAQLPLKPLAPNAPATAPPVAATQPTPGTGPTLPSLSAESTPAAPPAARPGQRTDETPPPTFAALSQWTELRISHDGQSRTVRRGQEGQLGLLLNSAAIMADGPQRLRGRAVWRVTLLRGGKQLAVLEVAPAQVQWTEAKAPPATGAPPAAALDALRAALGQAMQPPPETAQPQALPLADRLERELSQPRAAPGAAPPSGPSLIAPAPAEPASTEPAPQR